MIKKASMVIDRNLPVSAVDGKLFSSFIEHLGRAVYGGIWEPESGKSDEEGFRTDVLELVRELKVPMVRYPGGNFVSGYDWKDGIGPREKRPKRIDLAWRTIEPNLIGTDEFARWAKKAGSEIMMAVNLGTGTMKGALDLLEYCNIEGDTYWSDLRRGNGSKEPYGIKKWCLGNEMDGKWQTGHKTPSEYARIAAETARAMKQLDPAIELIACGSSNAKMATFPEWERIVLTECYDDVDYISMHQYFGKTEDGTPEFLANSVEMDRFIKATVAACDYAKAVTRSKKDMMISFDEYNVWYHAKSADDEMMKTLRTAPPLLEDIYTHEDALLLGSMLITLLKHSDRVKIACLAQLVNVIAPIMVRGDRAFRQTIYYPYMHVSTMARGGVVLCPIVSSPKFSTPSFEAVDLIDAVAVLHEEEGTVTVFAVSKSESPTELDITSSWGKHAVISHIEMTAPLDAVNSENGETVAPKMHRGEMGMSSF
ncbi:MAG: alpha-N-arabinofuranosidase [Bullifex sp.]